MGLCRSKEARLDNSVAPFMPSFTRGKVVDVYDGDTITVAAYQGKRAYGFKVRLRGIDTPELRTRRAVEKAAATRARDYLRELALNCVVSVSRIENDKYGGRYLADVSLNGRSLADTMLEHGLARPYAGKAKKPWTAQALSHV
jgi:endonuclease YncB( thermonuclease family)